MMPRINDSHFLYCMPEFQAFLKSLKGYDGEPLFSDIFQVAFFTQAFTHYEQPSWVTFRMKDSTFRTTRVVENFFPYMEFKALCERLGIDWIRADLGIQLNMEDGTRPTVEIFQTLVDTQGDGRLFDKAIGIDPAAPGGDKTVKTVLDTQLTDDIHNIVERFTTRVAIGTVSSMAPEGSTEEPVQPVIIMEEPVD